MAAEGKVERRDPGGGELITLLSLEFVRFIGIVVSNNCARSNE